jgi:hypothetical protein
MSNRRLCLVVGIVMFASTLWADHPQERQGFWIGFGGGYGSADVSCDACDNGGREGSFTGFLKLGGTLNKRVLLGVEGNAWVKEQDNLSLGSFTGTVTFYPQASSGFFLKGGVGVSYIDTAFREESPSTPARTGWGVLAGIGYDLRVGRNISITPSVNFYYGQPRDLSFELETFGPLETITVKSGGWKQNVIDFGIGITFH